VLDYYPAPPLPPHQPQPETGKIESRNRSTGKTHEQGFETGKWNPEIPKSKNSLFNQKNT